MDDFDKFLEKVFKLFNSSFDDDLSISWYQNESMKVPEIKINGKKVNPKTLLEANNSPKKIVKNGIRTPFVDQFVDEDKLKLYVELPGSKKEDIDLYYSDTDRLEIESKLSDDIKYKATIKLIEKVDLSKIKTQFNNGILELSIPLQKEEKKSIPIE